MRFITTDKIENYKESLKNVVNDPEMYKNILREFNKMLKGSIPEYHLSDDIEVAINYIVDIIISEGHYITMDEENDALIVHNYNDRFTASLDVSGSISKFLSKLTFTIENTKSKNLENTLNKVVKFILANETIEYSPTDYTVFIKRIENIKDKYDKYRGDKYVGEMLVLVNDMLRYFNLDGPCMTYMKDEEWMDHSKCIYYEVMFLTTHTYYNSVCIVGNKATRNYKYKDDFDAVTTDNNWIEFVNPDNVEDYINYFRSHCEPISIEEAAEFLNTSKDAIINYMNDEEGEE